MLEIKCTKCDKPRTVYPKELKNSRNLFCSRSCAASFNNKDKPKRTRQCKICKAQALPRKQTKYRYCAIHLPTRCKKDEQLTICDLLKNSSDRFTNIRMRAKAKFKDQKTCQACGYDKHVEVCHIKPISQFSLTTLISIVNDLSNIKILCPNCHWEFDNGVLDLDKLQA